MSGGKSLALFEVEVAEVGTCLTLWATEGLATIPANSGPIKSSRDSSVANGSDSCKEKILKSSNKKWLVGRYVLKVKSLELR